MPLNSDNLSLGDLTVGVPSSVVFIGGSLGAWGLRSIPECMEQANACGGIATVALLVNLVYLGVKHGLTNKVK